MLLRVTWQYRLLITLTVVATRRATAVVEGLLICRVIEQTERRVASVRRREGVAVQQDLGQRAAL